MKRRVSWQRHPVCTEIYEQGETEAVELSNIPAFS